MKKYKFFSSLFVKLNPNVSASKINSQGDDQTNKKNLVLSREKWCLEIE